LTRDLVPTEGEVEMAEQRVPNLDKLDEQEAHRFLAELRACANREHIRM
jgi:hypothetical protein